MITRRTFVASLAAATLAPPLARRARAQTRPTIDVKKLGAFGNGKLPDLRQILQAIESARTHPAGATIYFPPGEYNLGAVANSDLLPVKDLQNVRFIGERATVSCHSRGGDPSIFTFAACRGIRVEGLIFRDNGLDRPNRTGAYALSFVKDEKGIGCEDIEISDCRFETVLGGVVCHGDAGRAKARGFKLTNLEVVRSYYGFNFADSGDDVVGRGLRCDDVQRSYFPYGVSNHDIELDTQNNSTGFTDVLIKCYNKDTYNLRAKVRCRHKRGGDAIVALDQQHVQGRGTIRNISLDLDIDDADCRLNTAILIRSFDPKFRQESSTTNRWDDISIDGEVRICERTKLIEIGTVGRTPGTLHIGERLARNPRLPGSFPGFVVDRRK